MVEQQKSEYNYILNRYYNGINYLEKHPDEFDKYIEKIMEFKNRLEKLIVQIEKVEKEGAKQIVKELKQKYKAERIHSMIPNIDFNTILDLVKKNDLGGE